MTLFRKSLVLGFAALLSIQFTTLPCYADGPPNAPCKPDAVQKVEYDKKKTTKEKVGDIALFTLTVIGWGGLVFLHTLSAVIPPIPKSMLKPGGPVPEAINARPNGSSKPNEENGPQTPAQPRVEASVAS